MLTATKLLKIYGKQYAAHREDFWSAVSILQKEYGRLEAVHIAIGFLFDIKMDGRKAPRLRTFIKNNQL